MDYITCIQNSIDYIEDNLKSEIALADCARSAGFSTYHYYRVFGAFVGMPVMEYVRKRKLAWALTELQRDRRIIDVAVDYGFGSERTFSRAFKKEYGMSPGNYRDRTDGHLAPARLVLQAFKKIHVDGGIVMEPKIITKPAFKVAGFELKTTTEGAANSREVPKLWDRYYTENWAKILHEQIKPVSKADLGLCFPGGPDSVKFSYVIGVEVADFKNVPEGMFKGTVPPATYAVFTTPPAEPQEFVKAIQGTWDYIFASWFPKSGYEFDEKAKIDFELYDERSQGKDKDMQADIYVPVVKKR